jgi:hypothetical protein
MREAARQFAAPSPAFGCSELGMRLSSMRRFQTTPRNESFIAIELHSRAFIKMDLESKQVSNWI